MPEITISATDGSGQFKAYLAEPKQPGTAPTGVVVVVQEIFGVNQGMREVADWFADLGFIAVCPDLFWRIEPGVELTDGSEAEWKRAFELMNAFDQDKGIADIQATITAARNLAGANGKAAVAGYCLGGRMAYLSATGTDADCAVGYYGVGLDGLLDRADKITHPLMLHIAGADRFVPPAAQEAIRSGLAGHKGVAVFTYPGVDHAFARRAGHSWNGRAAAIADGRTAEFLVENLA